jgi:hypothetical protein
VSNCPAKLRNNILAVDRPLLASFFNNVDAAADQQWAQNTIIGDPPINCGIGPIHPDMLKALFPTGRVVETPTRSRIEMSGNLIDGPFLSIGGSIIDARKEGAREAKERLQQQLVWQGSQSLFLPRTVLRVYSSTTTFRFTDGLAEWRQFSGDPETGSMEGRLPRYLGGDPRGRAAKGPERLTPADSRLHPDSAGHGAGLDGKDLGADVDLVGPGAAYERWKKTPDYQQWLKDTGQTN